MLVIVAWRNVWRNGRRSGILVAAIAFGIWAGLFEIALSNGMAVQQVNAAVRTRTSHLQLHAPGFLGHEEVSRSIPVGDSVLAAVRRTPGVVAAAGRAIVTAMIASATTARGVEAFGVDPRAERVLTDVPEHIVSGHYLDPARRDGIVIGERLAARLHVRPGQRVVLTGQGGDGSLCTGAFRVAGCFRTASSAFDESAVFVQRSGLASTFVLGRALHEIAVRVRGLDDVAAVAARLRRVEPHLEVATWRTLSPEVALTRDSDQQMNEIFLVILLLALVFGITNTMLMGVLERTRELGVLMALGMRPARIFTMILLETVMVSVVGGAAGMLLAAASVAGLARPGLDLSVVASGLAALGLDRVIHPLLPAAQYPWVVALVVLTAIVASLYPGWKAIRLDPAAAIRSYP